MDLGASVGDLVGPKIQFVSLVPVRFPGEGGCRWHPAICPCKIPVPVLDGAGVSQCRC